MVAGVEPALLQADVIGCRIRRQQLVHHQTLFAARLRWAIRPWRGPILDVLVTTIAARATGDELVVEVDADPVGIGFDRQSTGERMRRGTEY